MTIRKLLLVCTLGTALGWALWPRTSADTRAVPQGSPLAAPVYADDGTDDSGELVVDFADDVEPGYVEQLGARLGLAFRPESRFTESDRVYVATVDPSEELADLAALRADPRVETAEENFRLAIPELALPAELEGLRDVDAQRGKRDFPNDPRFDEQWHMQQLHLPASWSATAGEGVIVAVIDTGVSRVEDLAQTEFVPGWNFVDNNDNADDDHGHGTHVAGTIAQSTHNGVGVAGVAYRARIMPLKVLSARGSGSVAGIAQAVRFAADHGAKVINMSLGGAMNAQVLARAVKYAHDKGVTVVCAAGNDGRGRVSYPAANPGSLAVAATQKDEKTTFYSNWGKQIAVAAPGGNTRDGAAGGVLQNTRFQGKDDYYFFMGTSMASPHVAGVAALVVASGVTDPDAVRDVLARTARRPAGLETPPADYAEHYGAGIVDAAAAVKAAHQGQGERDLGAAAALCAALLFMLHRSKKLGGFGLGGAFGVVMGSSGLFFLPQLASLLSSLLGGRAVPGMSLLGHGFPAWDQALLGAAGHGNPLFYSALAPIAAAVLLYSFTRLRGLVAGFAFGVAGHLLVRAFAPTLDIRFIPADALWLCVNAAVSALLGWLVARR